MDGWVKDPVIVVHFGPFSVAFAVSFREDTTWHFSIFDEAKTRSHASGTAMPAPISFITTS